MESQQIAKLLPDRLKELWAVGESQGLAADDLWRRQQELLEEPKAIWANALRLDGFGDLKGSLLGEIARYIGSNDLNQIERRCRGAVEAVKDEWHQKSTDASDRAAVEHFYDASEAYIFELMWWHTLVEDLSPLAYVVALQFAQQHGCRRYLDFGAGVGSAGILFAHAGFEVSLADISGSLMRFALWRLQQRKLTAQFIDEKIASLPAASFDLITAMDVWEHLADPVATVDEIAAALVPGGFLFGRFAAELDPKYPQHIVTDFQPTFDRLAKRGLVEVWRDQWLWGHQVFQKQ